VAEYILACQNVSNARDARDSNVLFWVELLEMRLRTRRYYRNVLEHEQAGYSEVIAIIATVRTGFVGFFVEDMKLRKHFSLALSAPTWWIDFEPAELHVVVVIDIRVWYRKVEVLRWSQLQGQQKRVCHG
jgi:hypothetical protein